LTQEERKQVAQRALSLVDLTDLNENCTHEAIDALCVRAQTPFGPVAAICIWPRFVSHAKKQLRGTNIPIATVVNFPGGNQDVDITRAETRAAIEDGAGEIDLVMPYQAFRAGDLPRAQTMVRSIAETTKDRALLKVILETGELQDPELIRSASEMAIEAGADFIKTSTGKVDVNATLDSTKIMLDVIRGTGRNVGLKPAGGIKTTEDCAVYLKQADAIMGDDWVSPRSYRFGASSVLNDLLAALEGRSAAPSSGY